MALVATARGAENLIALYPPTKHNLHVFVDEKTFVNAHEKLERGVIMVITPEHSCFIPSGWLHTLYTTQGGITATLDWSASACLDTVMDIVEIHKDRGIAHLEACCGALLDSIDCNLREGSAGGQIKAIEAFDKAWMMLGGSTLDNPLRKHPLFDEVLEHVDACRKGDGARPVKRRRVG